MVQNAKAISSRDSEFKPRRTLPNPADFRTWLDRNMLRLRAQSELNARVHHQAALAELGKSALAGTNVPDLFERAVACITQTLRVDFCHVLILLPDGKTAQLQAGCGWKAGYVGSATLEIGPESRLAGVFLSDNPIAIKDLKGVVPYGDLPLFDEHGVTSSMSLAIRGQGRPFGSLGAHTRARRNFTANDRHFLGAVAAVLALALQRRQSEDGLRRYAERLNVLQEIDRAILAARSAEDIARVAMSHIRRLVPCQRASVVLFDFAADQARVMISDGEHDLGAWEHTFLPTQVFSPIDILKQGPVRYVKDILAVVPRPPVWDRLLLRGIRSFISVPLFAGDELFGEFNLSACHPASFNGEYMDIAHEVAHSLAVAIQQASLREEATQAELLRRADETHKALLNSVSHNLRTPLSIIKAGAGSLLQEDVTWTVVTQREFALSIDREVDRLNSLVGNLLDMSRIEAGVLRPDKESYPVWEVTQAVASRLADLAARHCLTLDVSDELPLVPLDYVQIDQVLSNLVENAINHTPPGTDIRIWACVEGDELRLGVSDRGAGIPVADRQRVFEKFSRLAPSAANGTGLGLTVSKGLVEAHGGRIWIEDTPGGGTTVVFTLPLTRHPALPPSRPLQGDHS